MGLAQDIIKMYGSDTDKIINQPRNVGGNRLPDEGGVSGRDLRLGIGSPDPMGVEEEDSRYWNAFMQGAVSPIDASIRYFGRVFNSESAMNMADSIKDFKERHYQVENPTYLTDLASGVGSMATFFIPAMLTGGFGAVTGSIAAAGRIGQLISASGWAVSAALESMAEAGALYDEVLTETGDVEAAEQAADKSFFANAALVGVTNKLGGLFRWTTKGRRVKGLAEKSVEELRELSVGNRLVKSILHSGGKGALTEGFQEGSQELIHDQILTGEMSLPNAIRSASIGAIIGGGMGAAFGGRQTQKQADAIGELERRGESLTPQETETTPEPTLREQISKQRSEARGDVEQPATATSPTAKPSGVFGEAFGATPQPEEALGTVAQSPAQFNAAMAQPQMDEIQEDSVKLDRIKAAQEENQRAIQLEIADAEMERIIAEGEDYQLAEIKAKRDFATQARASRQEIINLDNDLDFAHSDLNRINLGFIQSNLLSTMEDGKADKRTQKLIPAMQRLHGILNQPNVIAEPGSQLNKISDAISNIDQIMANKEGIDKTNYTNTRARLALSKGRGTLQALRERGIGIEERKVKAEEGSELTESEVAKKNALRKLAPVEVDTGAITEQATKQTARPETESKLGEVVPVPTEQIRETEGARKKAEREVREDRLKDKPKETKPVEKLESKPVSELNKQLGKFTQRPATESKLGKQIPLSEQVKEKKETTPPKEEKKPEPTKKKEKPKTKIGDQLKKVKDRVEEKSKPKPETKVPPKKSEAKPKVDIKKIKEDMVKRAEKNVRDIAKALSTIEAPTKSTGPVVETKKKGKRSVVVPEKKSAVKAKKDTAPKAKELTRVAKKPTPYTIAGTPVTEEEMSIAIRHALSIKPDLNTYDEYSTAMEKYNAKLENDGKKPKTIKTERQWKNEVESVENITRRQQQREDKLLEAQKNEYKDKSFPVVLQDALNGNKSAEAVLNQKIEDSKDLPIEDRVDDRYYIPGEFGNQILTKEDWIQAAREVDSTEVPDTPEVKVEKATKGKEATKKAKATKVAKKQKRIANVRLAPLKKQLNSLKSQNAYMQEEVDKFKEGEQESPGLLKEIAKNEAEISRIEEEINQINPEEIEVEKETKKLSKKEQAAVDLEADLENYQEGGQNVVVDSVQEVTGEDFTQMDILSDQDIADSDYYELSLVNNPEQIVDAEKMIDPKRMATHIRQVRGNIAKITDELTDRGGAVPTEVIGYVEDLSKARVDGIRKGFIKSGMSEQEAEDNLQRVGGLYTHNRVFIIASRVRSPQAAVRMWLHEQVGHNGLIRMFNSYGEFQIWANWAFEALVKDEQFRPIMEQIRDRYTTVKGNKKSFGITTVEQRETIVIESMARYAESMGTEVREGIIEKLRVFLTRLLKRLNIQFREPTAKDAKALMEASHYYTLTGKHFVPVRYSANPYLHMSLFGEVAKRFSIDPMALIDARHEMEWNNPVTKKGTTFRGALMHAHEIKDVLMSRIGVIKNQVDEGLYTAMGIKFDPNTIDIRTGIIGYRTTDVIKTGDAVNLFRDSLTSATPDRQQLVLNYKAKLEKAIKEGSYDKLTDTTKVEAKEQLDLINRAMNLSPKLKAFSETITPLYEEMFNLAKAAGIQMEHIDAYGKRVWKARKGQEDIWNSGFGKGLRAKLTSQNKRTFTSIVEGWEQGMKLQVGGVSDNLHAYATELVNVMANMKYVDYGMNLKDSTGRPLFAKGLTEQAAKSMGYRKVKGAIFEKYDLYAPKQAADYISVSGGSVISDNTVLDKILKFQVNVKSMILSGTPFHYFAGARSWVFGIGDKKKYAEALKKAKADPNLDTSNVAETIGKLMFGGPKQAYKQGLKSIRASAPIYELLVRNGLTQETARDVNYGDGNLIMKLGNKLGYAGVYSAGRELQVFNQNLQRNLFQKYFAGLKSQGAIASFLIEKFKAETKKNRTLNPQEVDKLAEGVAIKINADFGGLHLKRMGRNPTLQKLAQAVLLAPDWTESNFRTVTGLFGLNRFTTKLGIDMIPEPEGIGGIYRGFWAKALPKIVAGTALSIAIGLLTSDPDDNEDYMKNVFWAGKMYASPISGLYDFLGISTKGASPYANLVAGHFADPLKLLNPVKLIKGKISPFARALDEVMWSQTDYRGVPFKTTGEFAEGVLKGDFGTTKASPYELKEDSISTILPTLIHVGKSMLPIPIQGTMKFLEGESDGLSAVFQAAGIHKGTGWDQQKEVKAMEDISSEIGAIDQKIKDATMIGNREMLAEGRKEKLQYKGFWTIKSRLNAVKNRIKPINRRLKKLKVISKVRDWTHQEELQYRMLKKKKVKYIKPLLKVYNRYQ